MFVDLEYDVQVTSHHVHAHGFRLVSTWSDATLAGAPPAWWVLPPQAGGPAPGPRGCRSPHRSSPCSIWPLPSDCHGSGIWGSKRKVKQAGGPPYKEPDSGGSLQQAGAAGDHLLGADHIIPVQLDQAKLVDATKNQVGFLRFHTLRFIHSSTGLLQATSQELNN